MCHDHLRMKFLNDIIKLYVERKEFFLELFIQHVEITIISISIITLLGLAIGVLISKSELLAKPILALSGFLYTIPSIAMFGILVTRTGIGKTSAIIAIVIYGLLPIIRNTYAGISEIDPETKEVAIGMGATPMQLLLRVELPLALPIIFAGFRTMVVMTIAMTGIAAFIGAGGLGVAIWRGITTNHNEMTIAGSLLVAIFAVLIDFILGKFGTLIKKR